MAKNANPPEVTMIDRTGMTIDAYLRHAGIKSDLPERSRTVSPLEDEPASPFNDLLKTARSTDRPGISDCHREATIIDYLRSCSATSTMPTSLGRTTIHGSRFVTIDQSSNRRGSSRAPLDEQPTQTEIRLEAIQNGVYGSAENGIAPRIHQGICSAAKKYNLSHELIHSVIQAESNFRPDAVSPAGAQGLMQLMPATARKLGVTNPFDVDQNIDAGARYLKNMMDRFDGDIKLALAAYNAGPGTVERYNGNVPYPETQHYVQRVLSSMAALKSDIG